MDEARDPARGAVEFAQESPGLEGGDALPDGRPHLRGGSVGVGLPTDGKAVSSSSSSPSPGDGPCRLHALVALVRPAVEAGLGESAEDVALACSPHETPLRATTNCACVPCFLCLLKGWPAAIRLKWTEVSRPGSGTPSSTRPVLLRERGGEGGQELDGLGHVAVDGGGADPEGGSELGTGPAVAEAGDAVSRPGQMRLMIQQMIAGLGMTRTANTLVVGYRAGREPCPEGSWPTGRCPANARVPLQRPAWPVARAVPAARGADARAA